MKDYLITKINKRTRLRKKKIKIDRKKNYYKTYN